ncbi:MAG: NAD(P)-dependent dehydrogenase (short-subunit alcohol dehydrogenase family) [Gammaproteobacteria bacterium]|jgi:NAD(P)-dependent dehydrogenase (short-subunit alcohol dehydrogenase family)
MAGLLEAKTIVITGGSTGIGRATARRCAEEGAAVVIADINKTEAQIACDEIKVAGGNVMFIETDVTDSAAVKAMLEKTVDTHGSLDGAFNNAGIEGAFTNIVKMTEAEFDRTVNVDLKGVWLCVKHEIEQFMAQGSGGSIVSTASVAGLVGARGGSAYCAAKHGVVGLTKSVALEYARKKIRVNAVCPGVIETPMLERLMSETGLDRASFENQEPMARFGNPQEIGEAVIWLLSDQSSFVTGIAMPVDGGYTAL